jgi:hypothetical protein
MQKSSVLKPSLKRAVPESEDRGTGGRRRRVAATLACVAVLGLFGTACSGSGDNSDSKNSSGSKASNSKTEEDKAVAHRQCLRDHGVKIDEPKGGDSGEGVVAKVDDKGTMEKAIKACKDKAPAGAGRGKEVSQADKDKALAFAKCMRENGYNMPDPDFDGGMTKARPMPKGAEKEKFEKANKACEGERP